MTDKDTTKTKAAPKTKKATTATAAKTTTRKPKAPVKKEAAPVEQEPVVMEQTQVETQVFKVDALPEGKYIYASGRRKTAVANVRLFSGNGGHTVNKKPIETYFHAQLVEKALEPFRISGLGGQYKVYANISGGGSNAQAEAMRHGIARALGTTNEDLRKVMKKNGYLTRDDRKKERKKPGLKGARRSPQWAKR